MSHTRGKIFIDRTVQGALAKRIFAHWCIFFGLSLLSLFAIEYFVGDPKLTFGGKLSLIWEKYAFFILLMITIVPSFIYDSIKLSNRFAGPMVRLRDSIKRIADGGEVSELSFRDGDFWQDVSVEFNRMNDRISETRQEKGRRGANTEQESAELVETVV
ncbi:MAG: hypothetical protein ACE361_17155 [Aureliella sp.]